MADEPTDSAETRDVILSRQCWIEAPDGEVSPLKLSFLRPERLGDDQFQAVLWIECKHFTKKQKMYGTDEFQAFIWLLHIGRIVLENREADGFSIWHLEKGDLQYFDFWGGSQFPQAFCLPSAYTRAKREAFYKANDGKFLMPSHRVGVEPNRPAVTIYRVNEDGTDSLGRVIGPEELKSLTRDSLEQLVGHRILWDSSEGVDIVLALPSDGHVDQDASQ